MTDTELKQMIVSMLKSMPKGYEPLLADTIVDLIKQDRENNRLLNLAKIKELRTPHPYFMKDIDLKAYNLALDHVHYSIADIGAKI